MPRAALTASSAMLRMPDISPPMRSRPVDTSRLPKSPSALVILPGNVATSTTTSMICAPATVLNSLQASSHDEPKVRTQRCTHGLSNHHVIGGRLLVGLVAQADGLPVEVRGLVVQPLSLVL